MRGGSLKVGGIHCGRFPKKSEYTPAKTAYYMDKVGYAVIFER
jgi:hypothetical protein